MTKKINAAWFKLTLTLFVCSLHLASERLPFTLVCRLAHQRTRSFSVNLDILILLHLFFYAPWKGISYLSHIFVVAWVNHFQSVTSHEPQIFLVWAEAETHGMVHPELSLLPYIWPDVLTALFTDIWCTVCFCKRVCSFFGSYMFFWIPLITF